MRSRWWMAAVLAAGLIRPAPAAAQSLPVTVFNDFKYGVGDILSVWTSPFRGSAKDYRTAALAVGGIGVVVLLDDEIGQWIWDNQSAFALDALDPFREREKKPKLVDLGAGNSLVQVGGGLYVLGLVFGSENLRDAGIGCVAAEKSNGLPRHFIYKGVSRERPLYQQVTATDTIIRRGDPYEISFPGDDEDWFDNSFFGGHGANIMACTSFLNHRFDMGLVEPLLWTVAVGVNLGRAADQRHWASDVAIGGVVGYAIGKYVAERSLDRKADRLRAANGGRNDRRGEEESSLKDEVLSGLWLTQQDGRTLVGWKRSF